jgi:hypothetical protein
MTTSQSKIGEIQKKLRGVSRTARSIQKCNKKGTSDQNCECQIFYQMFAQPVRLPLCAVTIANCCFFCSRRNLGAIIHPNGVHFRRIPPLTCQFESFNDAKWHVKGGGLSRNVASAGGHDGATRGGCVMRGQRAGRRERPGRQATRRDHPPNKRGAVRGGGVMKGGGEAKAPDNVMQCDATTNEWVGVKRGGGAG